MSGAATKPLQPEVSISGKRVTVSFDMPFMAGDACISPRNYEKTTVNRVPEVSISLENNLSVVRIQAGGSWYTNSHSQLHGLGEFLPDMDAFLEYWIAQKDRDYYEKRIKDLERLFKDQPEALERIKARHVELLQAEISKAKAELGNSIVMSTQHVLRLEADIAKATGSTS